jgi:hypothetical protein
MGVLPVCRNILLVGSRRKLLVGNRRKLLRRMAPPPRAGALDALDLGVQLREVGVVAGCLRVVRVVSRLPDLPRADALRQDRAGGDGVGDEVGLGLASAPQVELVPDGPGPEHDPEHGEQRPLERVGPAEPVTSERPVELPVTEPQHPPECHDDEQVPAEPAR